AGGGLGRGAPPGRGGGRRGRGRLLRPAAAGRRARCRLARAAGGGAVPGGGGRGRGRPPRRRPGPGPARGPTGLTEPPFPRSAWERAPRRSAARQRSAGDGKCWRRRYGDAERRQRHSHAERGNEETRPMLSRRDFLRHSSLLALAPAVPGFLARTARAAAPQRDGRVLVVIQLDGGNDGINTVVPFADDGYARHRKTLRLARE